MLVGASWAEEGTLVSRCSPRWRSHWLRHPEMTGACLDGTHGYCGCPAQARSIAFMEGQCTGLVLCPFTYCLEFPDVRVVLPGVPRVAVANFAEAGPHCLE